MRLRVVAVLQPVLDVAQEEIRLPKGRRRRPRQQVVRLERGGTLDGTIAALNRILGMTVAAWRAEGGTMVIPNQGRVYDEGDVAEYRDMVTIVRDRVRDALDKGQTLEQVKAARLARDYDPRYGSVQGPADAESFIAMVYRSSSSTP